MIPATLWLLCLTALGARAQETTTTSSSSSSSNSKSNGDERTNANFYSGSGTVSTISNPQVSDFSGSQYTYLTAGPQSTVKSGNGTDASSSGGSQMTRSTSQSLTRLVGSTKSSNATTTSTSTATLPSNTLACNGYTEFCNRQYSNITQVCAHNSEFAVRNNIGSNQFYGVIDQLNDGVRMLQGETHIENGTVYNCHTTCELLNAGTFQSSLEVLGNWLDEHPYDVVTWLIVNSDKVQVDKYVPSIQNSGIMPYLYEPKYVPQRRDQWPTLAEMIISGKRLVLFMDYNAKQSEVPYVLDEFTHMWETPYSPTNQSFPCTQDRPPGLGEKKAREKFMYLANHNLNTAVDLNSFLGSGGNGQQILIPNTAEINMTNGQQDKFGQLENMRLECTAEWDRPPNFLLVDYYNYGHPDEGSVFEVAARANGVEYKRSCCGGKSAAPTTRSSSSTGVVIALALGFALLLWAW